MKTSKLSEEVLDEFGPWVFDAAKGVYLSQRLFRCPICDSRAELRLGIASNLGEDREIGFVCVPSPNRYQHGYIAETIAALREQFKKWSVS